MSCVGCIQCLGQPRLIVAPSTDPKEGVVADSHCDPSITGPDKKRDVKACALVEKKSVINLIEAFAVAVKHYLRGEDGIYYE